MSLARIQQEFLEALLGEAPLADPGMAVYRENALAVRREALAAAHPVVRRLVGAAFFAEAATRFARAHPSTSGDLTPTAARPSPPSSRATPGADLPYLSDVARLEWAVHECGHAADGAPLDHAALAACPARRCPR
jgi:hypothetical protein